MASTFDAVLPFTIREEGGAAYTNDPADAGGPTKFGITLATLQSWREADCMAEDVEQLDQHEAEAIYAARFWNPARCDALPIGVDAVVFDFGVTSSPVRSARFLQQALGFSGRAIDGAIGPQTLAAAAHADLRGLIGRLHGLQRAFYDGLPGAPRFGRGWDARCDARQAFALGLLHH